MTTTPTTHTPASSTDSLSAPHRLSYFLTDHTPEELQIFTPYASTSPLVSPDPILATPLSLTNTTHEATIAITTTTTSHQYPPPSITITATIGRVTLNRTYVTLPDYPGTPVWSINRPPKSLVQPGGFVSSPSSSFRIGHQIRVSDKVTLYRCQDMDAGDIEIILAVPSQWTFVQDSSRWTYVCRFIRLLGDRLAYSLTQCLST
jgi:hypothetical protein